MSNQFDSVSVVDQDDVFLSNTSRSKARHLIQYGKAVPVFVNGSFKIRILLNNVEKVQAA